MLGRPSRVTVLDGGGPVAQQVLADSAAQTPAVDVEHGYSSQYEEKLDPFSSFNRKEKMRRYMNLKPYDKITLSMVSRVPPAAVSCCR